MKSTKKVLLEVTDKINAMIESTKYELVFKDKGVALLEVGTEKNAFDCGFVRKKNLHQRMEAFICGLEIAKK